MNAPGASGAPLARPWVRPLLRFGMTGVLSTLVHVATAATLLSTTPAGPALANGTAFCAATLCSYLLNTLWSFSARLHRSNLLRFVQVSLLGLAMTTAIAHTVQRAGGSNATGIAMIVLLVPPVTFLLHRHWTYRASGSC